MSHANNSSVPVSGALKSISIILALLMLGVSCYHAGSFLWRTSGDSYQRYAMVVTVFGLLAASHCLSHSVGQALRQSMVFIALMCVGTVVPLEAFSIATSAAALDSRVVDSVRRENQASPEYKAALRTVDNYQQQIEALRQSTSRLPDTYVSKRESIYNKIAVLQTHQDNAQQAANNINVSTNSAVYTSLENSVGVTSADVSRTAAVMLSITPITLDIAFAAVAGAGRKRKTTVKTDKAQSGKKSERHLSAV